MFTIPVRSKVHAYLDRLAGSRPACVVANSVGRGLPPDSFLGPPAVWKPTRGRVWHSMRIRMINECIPVAFRHPLGSLQIFCVCVYLNKFEQVITELREIRGQETSWWRAGDTKLGGEILNVCQLAWCWTGFANSVHHTGSETILLCTCLCSDDLALLSPRCANNLDKASSDGIRCHEWQCLPWLTKYCRKGASCEGFFECYRYRICAIKINKISSRKTRLYILVKNCDHSAYYSWFFVYVYP